MLYFHQQQDHVLLELSFKDQIFFFFVKSFKDFLFLFCQILQGSMRLLIALWTSDVFVVDKKTQFILHSQKGQFNLVNRITEKTTEIYNLRTVGEELPTAESHQMQKTIF